MTVHAVLGAGSWGTTLAAILASEGRVVKLWVRDRGLCDSIRRKGENEVYIPGVKLPGSIAPTTSIGEALAGADFIVSAIPSHGLRRVFAEAGKFVAPSSVIVSATKGIEEGTLLTASGVIRDVLGSSYRALVVLSGPSFAKEVIRKLPAAVCASSADPVAAGEVQKAFSTPYFRVYTNSDVIGVELGGALKNVIAIAAGVSDGLGLGYNARAALITRGLAEMTRLGAAMGANPITFSGLSGLGDLVLTCTANLSRNYSVGLAIAEGGTLDEITGRMRMVAEGVKTSNAVSELAAFHNIEMPISRAVRDVLYGGVSPKDAVTGLMTRALKDE